MMLAASVLGGSRVCEQKLRIWLQSYLCGMLRSTAMAPIAWGFVALVASDALADAAVV